MSTTIQVRTDPVLKKHAQKILEELGLDLSSAINVYLKQIVVTGSIPFPLRTINGFTDAQEQNMLRETQAALKNEQRFASPEEMHNDILCE